MSFFQISRISWLFLPFSILIISSSFPQTDGKSNGKTVRVPQGYLKGKYSVTREGRLFLDYWGIPYGKAGRFELSHPAPKWKGTLEAYKKPPTCPYMDLISGELHGNESCLFINIHTPHGHSTYHIKNLPVFILIHGSFSAFQDQAGYFEGAKYFLDLDLVLVTFNYRIGPLGFLSTSDTTIPANLGLKDQLLALKWVHKNIHVFGGDPSRVTLIGFGSGAASVHYHVMSPHSKYLFSRGILQSGNALCPWALVDEPDKSLMDFAQTLKCSDSMDSKEIVACLKQKKVEDIVKVGVRGNSVHELERNSTGNNVFFGPVVEHWMRNWPEYPSMVRHYPQNLLKSFTEPEKENASESGSSSSTKDNRAKHYPPYTPPPLLMGVNQYDGVTLEWAEHLFRLAHEPWDWSNDYKGSNPSKPSKPIFAQSSGPGRRRKKRDTNETATLPDSGISVSTTTTAKPESATLPAITNNASTTTAKPEPPNNFMHSPWASFTLDNMSNFFSYRNRAGNRTADVNQKVVDYYWKGKLPSKEMKKEELLEWAKTFFQALSHRQYFQCARKTAVAHSKVADVYLYYLTYFKGVSHLDFWENRYDAEYNLLKNKESIIEGPVHGDELQYLFDLDESGDFPNIRPTYRNKSLGFSKSLVKLWYTFGTSGKPGPNWIPLPKSADIKSLKWTQLSDHREEVDEPFRAHLDFWDSLDLEPLKELPPLPPKNQTHTRPRPTKKPQEPNIVYVDVDGDDDGTGGLFKWPDPNDPNY